MAILKSLLGSKKDDSAKAEMGVDTFNLIKIFRAMSYRLGETVSDLLDNSIDALATEVKITYKTPRAIYAIVEGRRAQSIIRSLLRATLVRFGKKMEGMFPEDDQLVADRILAE